MWRTLLLASSCIALASLPALAQSTVAASPKTGTPTQALTITGTNFADQEAVDLYLDTTDTTLLVSSSTGALSATLTLPATEQPGTHYITAIGRRSGDAAQIAITVSTPWGQPAYGQASQALNPYENTINTSNVASLGVLWASSNGSASGATPTVAAGKVFNATTAGIQALSTATGAVLWTAEPTSGFYSTPTVVNGNVYAGNSASVFYSLKSGSGAANWAVSLGSYTFSSAVVANGIVYVGCADHKVYALQASTGATLWTYTTGAAIDGTPAVAGGVVYIGSEDDKIYALNAATGTLLWSYTTGSQVESTLAVANGILVAASDDGNLYALRAVASPIDGVSAGSLIWSKSGAAYEGPAIANGTVFYGYSTLYAANLRSGTQSWSFTPDSYIRGRVIVANNVVYFTSASGLLYALNATSGAELSHAQSGGAYLGGPSISDGVVYVNADEAGTTAYALQAGTGAVHRPNLGALHPDFHLAVSR